MPSSPIAAHIDRKKIEMALDNLLFHVLKHCARPSTIRLILKADHRQFVIGIEGDFSSHQYVGKAFSLERSCLALLMYSLDFLQNYAH